MKLILDFIIKHYELIGSTILVICSLVLAIVRKKPVLNEADNILVKVLERLPVWIKQAEALKGADVKKSIVLESAKKYVKDEFSISLTQPTIDFIGSRIEDILSTPQKKEEL